MCGIVAVVRGPSDRQPPKSSELETAFGSLFKLAGGINSIETDIKKVDLVELTKELETVKKLISGVSGGQAIWRDRDEIESRYKEPISQLIALLTEIVDTELAADETSNAQRRAAADIAWAILNDHFALIEGLRALGAEEANTNAIDGLISIHDALRSLDRLEVRGRDSLGLHIFIDGHGLNLDDSQYADRIAQRSGDPSFVNNAVRRVENNIGFVYKESAEIGELGDNSAALRTAISKDDLLREILASNGSQITVLGHTRWASIGIVSEANTHPINSELASGQNGPYQVAVLNGDVDNYADLAADAGLEFPKGITTDAKVIPTLVSHHIKAGLDPVEAFRTSVSSFDGSVAIALVSADDPGRIYLAQRGSGQAVYIGLLEDGFMVASEPYGLVELTDSYTRLDGESLVDDTNPSSAVGQIAILDRNKVGTIQAIERRSYDGTELPLDSDDITTAQITTSDIDRGDYPHFLLKEISESPRSFRTTLAGKLVETDHGIDIELPANVIPADIAKRISDGEINRIITIGQGTAAMAARATSEVLSPLVQGLNLSVEHQLASELSGFGLQQKMDNVLVIAVSQSGTTTDTNTTANLARQRGAAVLAIVNRRATDLTEKAHGVLYTSDGRDVEMSVASTKAFYSQVAAGFLLSYSIARLLKPELIASPDAQRVLRGLKGLPEAMEEVLESREKIADIANRLAPPEPYWAVVGSGSNRVAAEEIRVKLSELCYKAIACDSIEDKKHIDLSSEPLIVVCAAGLTGGTAVDAAKEVGIFRSHKARPVVIASNEERRFGNTDVISVPTVEPELGFVLSAIAGHLFGYEAALAIDSLALPLRKLRASFEGAVANKPNATSSELFATLQPEFRTALESFERTRRQQRFDGHLKSSIAFELGLSLRYAARIAKLETYSLDFGKVGTPATVLEDLNRILAKAIDELTRPIDAIKHQAKTVTVGISRTDEGMLHIPLVTEVLDAGAARDALSYHTLRALVGLDPVIEDVRGFTRYRIDGDPSSGAEITVLSKGGISTGFASRVETDNALRGTKHRVAVEKKVLVTRGRRDDRVIVLIPETKDSVVVGLTLLHVVLKDRVSAEHAAAVLGSYRGRLGQLRDAVLETEATFDKTLLSEIPTVDLLTSPVLALADRWKDNS